MTLEREKVKVCESHCRRKLAQNIGERIISKAFDEVKGVGATIRLKFGNPAEKIAEIAKKERHATRSDLRLRYALTNAFPLLVILNSRESPLSSVFRVMASNNPMSTRKSK